MTTTTHSSTEDSAPASVDERHRRGTRGFNRISLALFAAGLTTFVSMYCTQALLPALSGSFGVSPASAALAVSVTTGVLALAIIPASALSERFGRTRVMVISASTSAVIGLLLPLSPTFSVLLAGRALQGLTLAGVPAVAMAYLAEEVHADSLGLAMGRYVAGTTLGGLLGRVVPSGVLDATTWRWGLEAAAVTALVCAVVFLRTLPRSRHFLPQPVGVRLLVANVRGHLSSPALCSLFALGFLLMGGFVSVYNFLGYRLMRPPFGLSEATVGLVFLMYLAGTVSSTVAGRIADRAGRGRTMTVAVLVSAAGLLVTIPDELPLILVGVLLFTGGFFAAHAVAGGWVGALATEHRAEASALYLFAYYLGSSVVGALTGLAFAAQGWTGLVVGVSGLLAVALALVVGLRLRSHPARH
ncbi:MFS transporter [Speluncibacter jeojiensis]|uniref:MFS transporter n=1 Tax=Speluncibacter jeojiensis TaxID=2710754 RepID=A0A9X4M2J5_9ACTN|nr:MFS transporter [Corynebacteriales bacterium D3-21]